ncbi:hypothetical protein OB919_16095 [Halobacteria archaeon AArc-curdl1]|uniref:Uncharacterized protein n=1 Tax=Natronosalvus hydrolyticus TaxID=2979988 RepID=A0AAP2ZAC8_9EURY|nr:hypothetical protein [Halobacteria archaeon AArc-curdl1]
MKVFKLHHKNGVKASCCNYRVSNTFWMAENREEAEKEIAEHTPDDREDHGNCPTCFASLLAEEEYEIVDTDQETIATGETS